MPSRYADIQFVIDLLRKPAVSENRLPAALVQQVEPYDPYARSGVALHVVCQSGSASVLGTQLVELDREFRRTAASLANNGALYPSAPIRAADGELSLLFARPGSADLLVAAYNSLALLLLSQPVQALIALNFFWERRPRGWMADPLQFFTLEDHATSVSPTNELDIKIIDSLDRAMQSAISRGASVRTKITVDRDSLKCEFETVEAGRSLEF